MIILIGIHKDEESVYGVTIPDIPGCFSWGDSINEAIENTKEAIYAHLSLLIESGQDFSPQCSDIETLQANEDYKDAFWALIDIDLSLIDPSPERVNISIPKFVLHRIDQYRKQHHETRSGFLARAAMNEIANTQKAETKQKQMSG